jgi:hypothetical protein
MSKAEEIRLQTNSLCIQFLISVLLIGYGSILVLYVPLFQGIRQFTLYFLLVALIYLIVLAYRIAAYGQGKRLGIPFIIGVVVIFGGAAFDMLATVTKSPDLSLEGNPYARMLLDTGHSVASVYSYAVVAQLLLQLMFTMLLLIFLRHKDTVLELAWEAKPKSRYEFVKAAFGMESYSWRQMWFSFKASRDYYKRSALHVLMFLICIILAAQPFRWWLGAEWFGIVPNLPDVAIVFGLGAIGIVLYFVWLLREYDMGKTTHLIATP